ncbi:DUF6261 family protein [Labilibacter marinus]|uniref:DUF6261 family protein n=1 Tax=Labilibacter marinus TaxID=1477105 RepID=UPI00095014A3|nr:DUF6261 family protein [Labilibacter marinus]
MDTLSLPKLKNYQLQSVTEDTISICNDLTLLEDPLAKISEKLDLFKGGMTKQQASVENKKELDTSRDTLTASFIKAVHSEKHYPYVTIEARNTMETLLIAVDAYANKITRLNYGEESTAIDNLILDLKKIDFTYISDSGLERWIPLIERSNSNFKIASRRYFAQNPGAAVKSSSQIAPELMDSLEGLYSMIYAHLKISPNKELKKAYYELQFLLDTYR